MRGEVLQRGYDLPPCYDCQDGVAAEPVPVGFGEAVFPGFVEEGVRNVGV